MKFELNFIENAVSGKILSQPHLAFDRYSVDNRDKNIKGSLFIPLVGENHDAHDYVTKAVENGATGVLVHKWQDDWEPLKEKASFIQVTDTLKALQDFAKAWRKELKCPVLALTGSNGKTTTKDFLNQILSTQGAVTASYGSFNNHWGVPFTLLNANADDYRVVLEMGMNHTGEISGLMQIGDPDFVMVTNVGRAHMGNFADGIEGVARAKAEIYESAKATAKLIFNIDNEYTRKMYNEYADRASFTYSLQNFSADVYFKVKRKTETGFEIEGQIGGELGKSEVQFWGEHNLANLAAAVCMAYIAGMAPRKIWSVIQDCHTGWGRNQWLELQSGQMVLFDGYNANPDSFGQLLSNVKDLTADRPCVALFGEMLELGDKSEAEHFALGKAAGELRWQQALFIGPSAKAFAKGWASSGNLIKPMILNTYEESLDIDLQSVVDNSPYIIVKGSRGGSLERLIHRLNPKNFPSK